MPLEALRFDQLDGELGGSARLLVAKINEIQDEINDFRADEAEATSESASLEDLSSATAALSADIQIASAEAAAALVSVSDTLSGDIAAARDTAVSESQTALAGAVTSLQQEISASDSAVEATLRGELSLLADRVGQKPAPTVTTDANPTVAAVLTPSPYENTRITARVVAMRDNHYQAAIYSILAMARAVPSEETLTLTANLSDGDQIEIDGETYTAEAALTPGGTNNFQLGGSASATLDTLIKAIDASGIADTDYGAGTAKHPTFTAIRGVGDTLIAIARQPGTGADGSSVTDPTDVGGVASWGAAVTSGGSDMTLFGDVVTAEHEDAAIAGAWDVTIAANGADVEISVTGDVNMKVHWQPEVSSLSLPTFV